MKKIFIFAFFSIFLYANGLNDALNDIKNKNYTNASNRLQMLCENKNAKACSLLGDLYSGVIKDIKNEEKSLKYYTLACNLSDAKACYNLAYAQENSDKKVNFLEKACSLADGLSCYELSYMYDNEIQVVKNKNKALNLKIRSCDFKYTKACEELSVAYLKEDISKSIHFALKACKLNHAPSCGLLGYIYAQKNDTANAKSFLDLGCRLQDGQSCYALAFLHVKQNKNDLNEAKKLTKKSCELGYELGCELFKKLEN